MLSLYNTAFEFSTLANYWVTEEEKLEGWIKLEDLTSPFELVHTLSQKRQGTENQDSNPVILHAKSI